MSIGGYAVGNVRMEIGRGCIKGARSSRAGADEQMEVDPTNLQFLFKGRLRLNFAGRITAASLGALVYWTDAVIAAGF